MSMIVPGSTGSDIGRVIRLGWELRAGKNGTERFEQRKRLDGVVECVACGQDIDLWADSDFWTQDASDPRRWNHSGYGPAMGVCTCGDDLYADDLEGRVRRYACN